MPASIQVLYGLCPKVECGSVPYVWLRSFDLWLENC
jgi:hypothetical protein